MRAGIFILRWNLIFMVSKYMEIKETHIIDMCVSFLFVIQLKHPFPGVLYHPINRINSWLNLSRSSQNGP